MRVLLLASLLLSGSSALAQKIVLANDDGWAIAQIRAQWEALHAANFDVVLSAPAENKSGTGSRTSTPGPRTDPCEFDSCPANSPAQGFNASNPLLNYVNGFPADGAKYGIQTLSPKLFGSKPDFVVSGPNNGLNTALAVFFSGTVGAASEGAKEGVPSIAFSGSNQGAVSYTTLDSDPTSTGTLASRFYADVTTHFMSILSTSSANPKLPSGVVLNVNYPTRQTGCQTTSDVKWVLARMFPPILALDVVTCNNGGRLPLDDTVVKKAGCFASVVALDMNTKLDASSTNQQSVLDSLSGLGFTCLP
ncbi:hypothetical protein QCA50_020084 [Cerrena zonata]|uniref:Survival protein SurE-like phosphatase/nucleotidase domain-containing protein n=1 Tax=Cerrena zonata TaxID=2478898 RepID=A0AAW0FI06_9APHY